MVDTKLRKRIIDATCSEEELHNFTNSMDEK